MTNLIRPDNINQKINIAYDYCKKIKWGINGASYYGMCQVDEQKLIKELMMTQSQYRDNFYVVDMGGGNFQWGKALAQYINNQSDLPKNAKLHIFNLRAEKYEEREYINSGKCCEFYLGEFKVENLFAEFKTKGFGDMSGKFDVFISRWSFRHLVDPVKSLANAHDSLRPETGMLLMDGFFFYYKQQGTSSSINKTDPNQNMIRLLFDMKCPFIMQYNDQSRSLNQFILKRTNKLPCQLPLSYLKLHENCQLRQIASNCIVEFKREEQPDDNFNWNIPRFMPFNNYFHGDKDLFDELTPFISNSNAKYIPLQRREGLNDNSLFEAIQSENIELFMECLDNDYNINLCNSEGHNPLCLSIRQKNKKIFDILLSRGAFKIDSEKPLHIAASIDTEGYFIEGLIKANPQLIDKKIPLSPLDIAMEAKNLRAVEILIEHDAIISEENKNALQQDEIFSKIYAARFPKIDEKPNKPTVLRSIINWVQEGHCVVLLNGNDKIMYNTPSSLHKLVYIDINPKFPILGEGEWPFYIGQKGYQFSAYDKAKIGDSTFEAIEQYRYGYF